MIKITSFFLLLALSATSNAAELPNHYSCSLYGYDNYDESFLIDFSNGHIYQIAYAKEIDRVKVRRYKVLDITQYNIRGVIEGRYLGDFLGDFNYDPWPNDKPKTLLSLDKNQGFFMKLFTGVGDFYGPCRISHENIKEIQKSIRSIGKSLKK